jgi:NhaP-type Na+/H+ or K+/H+ antiporter
LVAVVLAIDALEYRLLLLLGGCAFVLAAWVPAYTRRRPLSVPIVLVAAGAVLFTIPGMPDLHPREHLAATEHLTEFGVIVALLGAGLKIDRRVGLRRWATTWRLLAVSMPLTIGGTALLGWGIAGLAPAAAVLLGAALAPTDPVLAADVQVAEPSVEVPPDDSDVARGANRDRSDDATADRAAPAEREDGGEDEVRFALTSEAGLNDGLAFPFVYAALAIAAGGGATNWAPEWLLTDVLGRVLIGVVVGWLIGRLLGKVSFDPPWKLTALADAGEGFVAVAATLLAYATAELVEGYGFLAVFVAAVALRDSERGHSYHRVLHNFAGQVEQVVVTVLLILLGGAAATGVMSALTWQGAAVGLALIIIVRPLSGVAGLIGGRTKPHERHAIAFFGIRGVGSVYYLAFALRLEAFDEADELWAIVTFTILASIVLHGVTATPVMDHLDRRSQRRRARSLAAQQATSAG